MNPIRIALDKATGSAMLLRRATLCAVIAALAGIALLALAGWFLTAAAMAGAAGTLAVQAFNYLVPSAAIRLLAILRTVSRYGERLWSHRAALEAMGGLRASLFARLAAQDSRTALPLSSGDAAARLTGDIDAGLNEKVCMAFFWTFIFVWLTYLRQLFLLIIGLHRPWPGRLWRQILWHGLKVAAIL